MIHVIVNGAGGSFGDADARTRFEAEVERTLPHARLTITDAGADIATLVSDLVQRSTTSCDASCRRSAGTRAT